MTAPDSRDSVELLPCPFCGSEAERIDFGPGSGDNEGGSCIACTKCQASGPVEFGYKENFVANWNRRNLARGQTINSPEIDSKLIGAQQAGGEDAEIREIMFGALDRDRDNITTRNLVVVAVNSLQRERDRAEAAEAALREAQAIAKAVE